MEVQKTALYNLHKSLGAKFVPFAGYEMPIQYKDGIVKEHISTRSYAGFFDVSHMGQFFLEGDDTLIEALEKIIPADLKSLKLNKLKSSSSCKLLFFIALLKSDVNDFLVACAIKLAITVVPLF